MMKKLRVRIESQWYLVEVGDLGNDDVEVIIGDQKFSVNLKKDVTSELPSSDFRASSKSSCNLF